MSILCNIGSLILGLLSWALPVAAMAGRKRPTPFCAASFFLCSLSLTLQLVNIRQLSVIGDYAAIEDTIGAVVFAAAVLLIMTAVLNTAALIQGRKR